MWQLSPWSLLHYVCLMRFYMSHTQLQDSLSLTIKHLFQNVVNVKCKTIKAAEDGIRKVGWGTISGGFVNLCVWLWLKRGRWLEKAERATLVTCDKLKGLTACCTFPRRLAKEKKIACRLNSMFSKSLFTGQLQAIFRCYIFSSSPCSLLLRLSQMPVSDIKLLLCHPLKH